MNNLKFKNPITKKFNLHQNKNKRLLILLQKKFQTLF